MLKKILLIVSLLSSVVIFSACQNVEAAFKVYDPVGVDQTSPLEVFVEGVPVFVYETRVNLTHQWSWETPETLAPVVIFDFNDPVEVEVIYDKDITSAQIKPLSANVGVEINEHTLTFTLKTPHAYILELNGTEKEVLHLFTHDIFEEKNLEDVTYFGPGVHDIDRYMVSSNETIIIDGGAIIYGSFYGYDVSNVTIKGRGVITGSTYVRDENTHVVPFEFLYSENIHLEGITFLDPAGWTIHSYFNRYVSIRGINIITARQNGDGISLQSNHDVYVSDSFVRSWDDSLVVKNYDRGTTSNILFERMTLWTDLAQSMEIGYETNGSTIEDVTFQDIIVMYALHKPVMSIHNGDDAIISNILFKNIIIEYVNITMDTPASFVDDYFIELSIVSHPLWSTSTERGQIQHVTFVNVIVLDGKASGGIHLSGYDESHRIEKIEFININYLGQMLNESSTWIHHNAFVHEIEII